MVHSCYHTMKHGRASFSGNIYFNNTLSETILQKIFILIFNPQTKLKESMTSSLMPPPPLVPPPISPPPLLPPSSLPPLSPAAPPSPSPPPTPPPPQPPPQPQTHTCFVMLF